MLKALGAGVALALVVVIVVVALAVSGIVPGERTPDGLIIIAAAKDAEGAEVATFAFAMRPGSDTLRPLDTAKEMVVPGTSARTPRDAYPFVGPSGVAELLKPSGESDYGWVSLPLIEWTALIDSAGGIDIDVPESVSVYQDGRLVLIDAGDQRLLGQEVGALASAVEFQDPKVALELRLRLTSAIASVIQAEIDELPVLIGESRIQSSHSGDTVALMIAEQ